MVSGGSRRGAESTAPRRASLRVRCRRAPRERRPVGEPLVPLETSLDPPQRAVLRRQSPHVRQALGGDEHRRAREEPDVGEFGRADPLKARLGQGRLAHARRHAQERVDNRREGRGVADEQHRIPHLPQQSRPRPDAVDARGRGGLRGTKSRCGAPAAPLDLARLVLDYPERDRATLVAALLYRCLIRAAPGGAPVMAAALDLGPLAPLLAALLRRNEVVIIAKVTPRNGARLLGLLGVWQYVLFTKIPAATDKALSHTITS